MKDQKLDNLLNLAINATNEEREKSLDLNVGYDKEEKKWEVILRYNQLSENLVEEKISLIPLLGGYGIAEVSEAQLEWLSRQPEIEYIEKPKRLYFDIFQGKRSSCINEVQRIEELNLTGKGIIVGIVDSGVDFFHEEFRNEDGSSRILFLWDQNISGNPPKGYKRGTEYTKKEIDEALAGTQIEGRRKIPSVDLKGHGTAVLGIAAGNHGVAYESELMVVRLGVPREDSFPRTSELMQGIDYLLKKAVEVGKPIAINLSFGNNYGSHRGDSLLETYIDMAAAYGRAVICTGTGNNGNQALHTRGKIRNEETQEIEFSIGSREMVFNLQCWKYYEDNIEISLEAPSGEKTGPLLEKIGAARYRTGETEILIYYGEPGPYFVSQEIYFDFIPQKNYIDSGIWKIILRGKDIKKGDYELWLPGGNILNQATGFYFPVPEGTLTIPSTAKKVISVAAYDSGNDSYADFSGRGSTLLFERKPDLAAPGVNIRAPKAEGGYEEMTGTSFAVPFVTGSAALLMQWGIVNRNDPYLYGEKVKAFLGRGARRLPGFEEYPNNEIGWGALCVENSIPK